MPAKVTLLHPDQTTEEILLGAVTTIGRLPTSDLCLRQDPRVSRQHAVIRCCNGYEYQIIDLGSRNGTFVNGQQVVLPVTLSNQAVVRIGSTEMHFTMWPDETEATAGDSTLAGQTETPTMLTQAIEVLQAAVMVCDVRSYSTFSEKIPPAEVSHFIGSWFRQAGEIVGNHAGKVDRFLGDAVLAYWVGAAEEACPRAYAAAEAMQRLAASMTWPRLGHPLSTAVALHFGKITQGNVGMIAQRDSTILGPAVNATFRMEGAMKALGYALLCSAAFYEPLAPLPDFEDGGEIALKGLSSPLRVFGRR